VAGRLARAFLALTRFEAVGARPTARRYVLIAAPHTSNWDLAYLLAFAAVFDVKLSFMAKHTLFRWPMGRLMRRLGGVPVRRHLRENAVAQMVGLLKGSEDLALTVPAEGTRSYVPHWKSGFYHIARDAGVPIVLGFLDFGRRRGGFGPEFLPTGNVADDMEAIRDFYADKQGLHPEKVGVVRLAEEL
jgi:1-acyl-sn-glycerol-3-phosphate acyltransferase